MEKRVAQLQALFLADWAKESVFAVIQSFSSLLEDKRDVRDR